MTLFASLIFLGGLLLLVVAILLALNASHEEPTYAADFFFFAGITFMGIGSVVLLFLKVSAGLGG